MTMTHAELMRAIKAEIDRLGLKVHGNCHNAWGAGFPDLVIAGPGGVLYREVKTERGRVEDKQWEWCHSLVKDGHDWQVWRPHQWPDVIKGQLERLAKV